MSTQSFHARRSAFLRAAVSSCLAAVASPAFAADSAMLDEVIVTASKRETNLQDTPIAVTAFSQTALDRAQVTDLAGLQNFVPNLTVEQHGDSGGVHVYLRGIGSANHTELGDPAVAFHVDEVYAARPQGATVLMYDVAQVEVLRGPQGTLFGRNSTAGTVNIVTAKPKLDGFDAYADFTYGNYDRMATRGMINMPVSDTFGVRIAAATERHDGYVDFQPGSEAVMSRKYGAADQQAIRLTGLFQPNGMWTVTGAIDYFKDNGTGNIALLQTPRAGTDRYSALVDTAGFLDQDNLALRLRVDFSPIDSLQVSYIGGKTDMERRNASDNDGGARPWFKQEHRTEWSEFKSYSHELNIKSIGDSRLQWIAGAYVMHEDNAIRFDIDISEIAAPPVGASVIVVNPTAPADTAWAMSFIQPERTLDSQAAYAQATFAVLDSLRVTAGARYTEEEKQDRGGRNWVCPQFGATIGTGGRLIGPGGIVSVATCGSAYAPGTWPGGGANDGQTEDEKTTWMTRIEFDINDDIMVYGGVSTGFKSGGLSDGGRRHLPEELTNYELGLKSQFMDKALTLNMAAFMMDYEDLQVSAVERLPGGQQQLVTSNAAAASIVGLEVELGWHPTDADSLTAFASFLNAEYDDFNTIDTTYFDQSNLGNTVNLSGQPLRHAPDFSVTGTYEHRFSVGNGAVVPRITFHYQTETTISAFNDVYPTLYRDAGAQDAYTQTDLGLRYEAAEGKWQIEAFVQNLEDEAVKTDIYNVGAASNGTPSSAPTNLGNWLAFYNPPRTYGVRFHVNF